MWHLQEMPDKVKPGSHSRSFKADFHSVEFFRLDRKSFVYV